MVSLGFEKKIAAIVLNVIDKKLGKIKIGGIPIDKITDVFQGQDNKLKDMELRLDALEHFLKDKENPK